jgi:hypothetical protein
MGNRQPQTRIPQLAVACMELLRLSGEVDKVSRNALYFTHPNQDLGLSAPQGTTFYPTERHKQQQTHE